MPNDGWLDLTPILVERGVDLAAPRIDPGGDPSACGFRLPPAGFGGASGVSRKACASASNPETPISGFPAANASPCIVAMPMRSPVNDPGPVATANTSISGSAMPACSSSAMRSPGSRAACGFDVVARLLAQHDAVTRHRAARRSRRRVERQDEHDG